VAHISQLPVQLIQLRDGQSDWFSRQTHFARKNALKGLAKASRFPFI
jgi:hypothetical protein